MPVTTFSRAGQWGPTAVVDLAGRPQPHAAVALYLSDGTTLATLYTDRLKATAAPNPTAATPLGTVTLFADPGSYVLKVTAAGVVTPYAIEVPVDPVEAALDEDVVALQAGLAAETGRAEAAEEAEALRAASTEAAIAAAVADETVRAEAVEQNLATALAGIPTFERFVGLNLDTLDLFPVPATSQPGVAVDPLSGDVGLVLSIAVQVALAPDLEAEVARAEAAEAALAADVAAAMTTASTAFALALIGA